MNTIVDVHAHVWLYPEHFSDEFRRQARRARSGRRVDLTIDYERYRAAVPEDTRVRTVIFGGKAKRSGLWVDDRYVADFVADDRQRFIGFLSVDPTEGDFYRELRHGHEELGLVGVKLLPMYAGFRPDDDRLDPLWRYAQRRGLPVLLHTGTTFVSQAPLDCTLPRHLDRVAMRFPDVRIVLAHLGHPYEAEALVTTRKHPNVYADVSALHYRPWQLYHSLMLAQEYGTWDKLLFGTDFPFTDVAASVAGLRGLNDMAAAANLPRLREDQLEALIYRDSLALLGLEC